MNRVFIRQLTVVMLNLRKLTVLPRSRVLREFVGSVLVW